MARKPVGGCYSQGYNKTLKIIPKSKLTQIEKKERIDSSRQPGDNHSNTASKGGSLWQSLIRQKN